MEFDKNRVYTALNAEEVKAGSKVYLHNCISGLKELVINESKVCLQILKDVESENESERFLGQIGCYSLCYLIEKPEEKKLKWTDLKIGDIIRKKYEDGYRSATVIRIDTYSTEKHIGLGGEWLTDDALEDWEKVE